MSRYEMPGQMSQAFNLGQMSRLADGPTTRDGDMTEENRRVRT